MLHVQSADIRLILVCMQGASLLGGCNACAPDFNKIRWNFFWTQIEKLHNIKLATVSPRITFHLQSRHSTFTCGNLNFRLSTDYNTRSLFDFHRLSAQKGGNSNKAIHLFLLQWIVFFSFILKILTDTLVIYGIFTMHSHTEMRP